MMVGVWLVEPSSAPASRDFGRRVRDESARRGWSMNSLRFETGRLPGGRPARTLSPRDATALYKGAHRSSLGVIVFGGPEVGLDPAAGGHGKAVSVERFLRYKAFVYHLERPDDVRAVDEFFADFSSWISTIGCEGEQDPRCMPLHVFDRSRDWRTLGSPVGRSDFNSRYGAGVREDPQGLRWQRARDLHGREVLQVAGRPLIAGYHWDVENSARAPRRVTTTHEVYEVSPRGYLNVHPDAHVGVRGSFARRIWSVPS